MKDDFDPTDIKFTFRCQKKWEDLQITDNHEMRFCNECNYHVHSIVNSLDLKKLDSGEECFAVKDIQVGGFTMGRVKKPLIIQIFSLLLNFLEKKT